MFELQDFLAQLAAWFFGEFAAFLIGLIETLFAGPPSLV